MVRLRLCASLVSAVAWSAPLFLAGCADTVAPRLAAPVGHHTVAAAIGSTANADADLIMAQAIAEHEIRQP
jgi:hypothetical protein